MSFSVAVVGLGRVGSSYDNGKPQAVPRSHVGAILGSPDYHLIAVCDSAAEARRRFRRDWHLDVPIYSSVEQIMQRHSPDLTVVAVSQDEQFGVLDALLSKSDSLIFCEKPLCSTLSEARAIQKTALKKRIKILVNFHRRWEPRFRALQTHVRHLGAPSWITVTYCKGTINYGSHIVDLLNFLFGPICAVQSDCNHQAGAKVTDPSYSCRLRFASGFEARLLGLDNVQYELFDVDIFYPLRKIRIELGGFRIEEFRSKAGAHYPGYLSLQSEGEPFGVGPVSGLREAYACIAAFRRTKQEPADWPTAETSVYVQRVLQAIVMSSRSGRRLSL